jgi:predicted ATPase
LDLSEKNEERWYSAELLGIKGDLLLLQSKDGARAQAEDQYESALKLARSQGALSFELRSAMRLFCLERDTAGGASASARLKLVYDRFSEGFGTADLKEAKALLDKREAIAPFKNANS